MVRDRQWPEPRADGERRCRPKPDARPSRRSRLALNQLARLLARAAALELTRTSGATREEAEIER